MNTNLISAIITISLALVFYTVGVWGERLNKRLKPWHLGMFWIGFIFDTTGTTLMEKMAGRLELNLHSVSGILAIVLMLSHAIWATIVLKNRQEKQLRNFHKLSLHVWLSWLIPFFSGMLGAMMK